MSQLTEYEIQRLANIERNQAALRSLGIFQTDVGPSKAKAVRTDMNNRLKLICCVGSRDESSSSAGEEIKAQC